MTRVAIINCFESSLRHLKQKVPFYSISGLFHRVILMSGSALSSMAIARDAMTYASHFGKVLNCPHEDNKVMVECLKGKSVDDILRVELLVPSHLSAFGPIVDGILVRDEPENMMKHNSNMTRDLISHYDLMFGITKVTKKKASFLSLPLKINTPCMRVRFKIARILTSFRSATCRTNTNSIIATFVKVEAPFIFSAHEDKHGITASRRDRILRTLVRNLFDFNQQVCSALSYKYEYIPSPCN